jgi:ABC-2 type transport system ATP-binding protein
VTGGKRRLLSVAVTLIAAPLVAFFDEPTVGLDPIAKRSVWRLLTQLLQSKKSSILLSTNSFTEAEALAHKIGILVFNLIFNNK